MSELFEEMSGVKLAELLCRFYILQSMHLLIWILMVQLSFAWANTLLYCLTMYDLGVFSPSV